jgi:hypothetical protein
MNDKFWTSQGERPDLAQLQVNAPEGFIGTKLFPTLNSADKSGTIYYATVTADNAAQTGRSAGTAPTATVIADSSTSFTCAEAVKRAGITPDEAKTFGGIEKADEAGAKWAIRQVQRAQEAAANTALLGGAADAAYADATLLTDVQTALDAVRLYEGKTALVGGTNLLKIIANGTTVSAKLLRIVTGVEPGVASGGLSFKLQMDALKVYLGVDEILAGDSGIWGAAGKVAIVKYDASGDALSHKYMPILGKTVQFIPDGSEVPFVVRSTPDFVNVLNLYDAFSWYTIKKLNASAHYVLGSVA